MNVAVLGASNKPERYSFQAVKRLAEKGHAVCPVHPALATIDGVPVFRQLGDIPVPLHTLTVYCQDRGIPYNAFSGMPAFIG